jgi:hypothetical protein
MRTRTSCGGPDGAEMKNVYVCVYCCRLHTSFGSSRLDCVTRHTLNRAIVGHDEERVCCVWMQRVHGGMID